MNIVSRLLEGIRIKHLFLLLWILMTVAYLVHVSINNLLSLDGEKLQQLEDTAASLRLQNQVLENEIASYSSLRYVEKRAKELGFDKAKRIEYIK